MIVDASVLLAVFFREKEEAWAREQLSRHGDNLKMSTVNLAEVLILVREKRPAIFEEVKGEINKAWFITFVPPSVEQAHRAAWARHKYKSLNFGDCFVYALAKEDNSPVLTLDGDFKTTDIEVLTP